MKHNIWNKINDRRRWQGIVLWICVAALLVHASGLLWPWTLKVTTHTKIGEMLRHGNTLHLFLNVNALLIVAFRMYAEGWKWLCGIVISVSLSMLLTTEQAIGLSGWIYAMLGLMTMKQTHWKWALVVYVTTIIMSAIVPGMAWRTHAWCYGLGLVTSLAVEPIYQGRQRRIQSKHSSLTK